MIIIMIIITLINNQNKWVSKSSFVHEFEGDINHNQTKLTFVQGHQGE
jgi:hypothetical protein